MYTDSTSFRDLAIRCVRSNLLRLTVLAALLLLVIGLKAVNPQVIRYFIDTARAGGPDMALWTAAFLFMVIGLTRRALAVATSCVGENVVWMTTNSIRTGLAAHCLSLDMSFHTRHTPGELVQRIDDDVSALGNLLSQMVFRAAGNAALILLISILIFREDPRLGAVPAVYTIVLFAVLRFLKPVAASRWSQERQVAARLSGLQEEVLRGTEDIRSSGAGGRVMRRLDSIMEEALSSFRAASVTGTATTATTHLLHLLGYATALAMAVYLYRGGGITIGTAYMVLHYTAMLSGPLEDIRREAADLQSATASIGRIDRLLSSRSSLVETPRYALRGGALDVEFDDVSFGYDDGPMVLEDVAFALPAGKVLGILGHTGGGKTTVSRLLFRLQDPVAGRVLLGGHDLRDLALDDVRGSIGMVTQDICLLRASVRDNLTLFGTDADDRRIVEVLELLAMGPWLESLPARLDTLLGGGGDMLSAGQAQLLAFARVFLKEPGLVILDEASSRLDPATEALVGRARDLLLAGRTGVIIAHRLATVKSADLIMVLEHGRITEFGAPGDLVLRAASRYAALLEADGRDARP